MSDVNSIKNNVNALLKNAINLYAYDKGVQGKVYNYSVLSHLSDMLYPELTKEEGVKKVTRLAERLNNPALESQ